MKQSKYVAFAALALAGTSFAGDLGIHVILSGQVAPGIYGQVQIGDAPPPPLVYMQPLLIEAQAAPPPPVYLHVPPGHARNWSKYCHAYNACNRPVYFVRSEEYAPGYRKRDHEHDHGHPWPSDDEDHRRDHDEHGHDHDHHGD